MNVRLKYSTYFPAGIFYAGQYKINQYRVTLHFVTGSLDPEDHNTALERVKYFLEFVRIISVKFRHCRLELFMK